MIDSRYTRFFIGLLMIATLGFIAIPLTNKFIISGKIDQVKLRDLDAGALIYSDSEEAIEGNFLLLKTKLSSSE